MNTNLIPNPPPNMRSLGCCPAGVSHVARVSQTLSTLAIEAVVEGVRVEDHASLKPYFRSLINILSVDDSRQAWRINTALTRVLETMNANAKWVLLLVVVVMVTGDHGDGHTDDGHDDGRIIRPGIQHILACRSRDEDDDDAVVLDSLPFPRLSRYIKATEMSFEMLFRVAKRVPAVAEWFIVDRRAPSGSTGSMRVDVAVREEAK
jgi:hypothetical protein